MKFKHKYHIEPGFEDLFSFKNEHEELEHEAKLIMFRFFSELNKIHPEQKLKNKDLAEAIQTSRSFITQLYRGDKLINLLTLAKIQQAYGITFEIRARFNSENYNEEVKNCFSNIKLNKDWNSLTSSYKYMDRLAYKVHIKPKNIQSNLKVA